MGRTRDRRLIAAIHRYQHNRSGGGLLARLQRARGKLGHIFWSAVSGSDIDRDATIDASARFPHLTGVVIHRNAVVGPGCMVMQQVTLGQTTGAGAPTLKAGAYVGAGAKVLGPVTVGEQARIGANAVVLHDVPARTTAVGIPARLIPHRAGEADA